MCRRLMSSLARVGVLAAALGLAGTQAQAQECLYWAEIGGSSFCAYWTEGSEVCNAAIKGLGGHTVVKNCVEGVNCPVVTCSAYGTVNIGLGGSCDNTDPSNLDPDCGIAGTAVCFNPKGKFNPQGEPFILPGVETDLSDVQSCDKRGKCTTSVELLPDDTSNICINPNWQFQTFTASEFKAQACFCPGGYAGGVCCADGGRNGGACANVYAAGYANEGTPACIQQVCTQTAGSTMYTCGDAYTCGGFDPDSCQQP